MNQHSLKCIVKMTTNVYLRNQYRPVVLALHVKPDLCTSCISSKNYLTDAGSYRHKSSSLFENIIDKMKYSFHKNRIQAAGYFLYECVADNVDYSSFMKEFNMPDTFNSWFLITELHVWMVMVKLMADPKIGRIARNTVVEALWKDVITRSKKLGSEHMAIVKSQIMQLSEEFQAALVIYDEGILSDDTVLASAVWRRILSRQCDARQLEAMVKYVRQTTFYLHKMTLDEILFRRNIKWIPISEVFKSLPS